MEDLYSIGLNDKIIAKLNIRKKKNLKLVIDFRKKNY